MSWQLNLAFSTFLEHDGQQLEVRPIRANDIETLRVWKNANRQAFFYKNEISFEQQKVWFESFSEIRDQKMFLLEQSGQPIGCVGFRVVRSREVDLFNLILGEVAYRGRGLMSMAYQSLEKKLSSLGVVRIEAKVIPSNHKAIAFYLKQEFRVQNETSSYLIMKKRIG